MDILIRIKFHLYWAGLFQRSSSVKAERMAIALNCIYFTFSISYFLASTWFLLFSNATSEERSKSIYGTLGSLLILYWYFIGLWKKMEYSSLIEELGQIIERRMEDPVVNLIYQDTKHKVEALTKNIISTIQIVVYIYCIPSIATSIFKYIHSGYSNESFQQIYPTVYPFDWKTPFGFIGCSFIQTTTLWLLGSFYVYFVILTVGFCLFITAFTSDLQEKLRQLNGNMIASEDRELTTEECAKLKKKFTGIFQFHSEVRDFAMRFSDANSGIVFGCPIYTIAVFGSLILQANNFIHAGDVISVIQIVGEVLASMLPFFLFCHFGGNVTKQFEAVGDAVYQLNWYSLPLDMQNDIRIMIALSQKSIYMRGYGDTRTTYSVLKKILKNKFYFFIVTRRF